MKRLLPLLFSVLFYHSFSQANFFQWANALGSTGADGVTQLKQDSVGNMYVLGKFGATVDFDPGPGVNQLTSTGSQEDMFFAKYDHDGNLIWVKSVEADYVFGVALSLDKYGNVFVTGRFYNGPVDFDPGSGVANLTSNSTNMNVFILKFDNNGDLLWAKSYGSTGSDHTQPYDIANDASGNVYVSGVFYGTCDFDPGTGVSSLTAPSGSNIMLNSYLQKLDPDGNFLWVKGFLGVVSNSYAGYSANKVIVDYSNNVIVGGYEYSTSTANRKDSWIKKLDPNGNSLWENFGISSSNNYGASIYVLYCDESNKVYAGGQFSGTVDFDPSSGVSNLSATGLEAFVSVYSSTGGWQGTSRLQGSSGLDGSGITSIAQFSDGSMLFSGGFKGTTDFDPGAGTQTFTSSSQTTFVLNLQQDGTFRWVKTLQPSSGSTVSGLSVLDAQDNIYLAGSFTGTVDFNPDAGVNNLFDQGNGDAFMMKLTNCIYNAPDICLVTVDSLANNNVIYFDKSLYPLADSFLIYRYDALTTNYLQVGAVAYYDTVNYLIDTARNVAGPNGGDPQYGSNFYKMAIRGVCGDVGTMGKYHQSLFIQQTLQNFNWNAYAIEGMPSPVTGYQFSRDNNGTGSWQVLANLGGLASTDPNYTSYPNGRWRVDALGFSCITGTSKLMNGAQQIYGAINTSRSNVKSPSSVGLQELSNTLPVMVYPNPAQEFINIDFPSIAGPVTIEIINAIGQTVYKHRTNELTNIIDVSDFKSGIYFVNITSARGRAVKKITVQ